jgi:predicted nucleic acid-binding protein
MRVVVDTNIFISAALKANSWPSVALHRVEQSGGLLKSA